MPITIACSCGQSCRLPDPEPGKPSGLTTAEAQQRQRQFGPNAVVEQRQSRLLAFLRKFWSPVPWMLEFTLLLELVLRNWTQSIIILILLILNAVLSFVQEGRAGNALALLRQRLTVNVRALRDGQWRALLSQDLVPGDVVHVRMGDLMPADVLLHEGQILIDQSALTGESVPVEAGPGQTAHAGSTVKRGEASGTVTATGQRTYFGKTAELVRTASTPSHLQAVIFTIVKYLVALDIVLVLVILAYALIGGKDLMEIIPFAIILLVASVPVALPATYTLASAVGSLDLSRRGVLVTRLTAVEEAAGMDVLCSDKTGTITRNQLTVASVRPVAPHAEADVLGLAVLACDEKTQDPIDLAILEAARQGSPVREQRQRLRFLPFDPATKRSEAEVAENDGVLRIVKGAPAVVAGLTKDSLPTDDVNALAAQGCRVLAVAAGREGDLRLAGLIGLQDPPRDDSPMVVRNLTDLGIRVVMVTGDGAGTAEAVARQVGIQGPTCLSEELRQDSAARKSCGVFAGVYPEDKFHLVKLLQESDHVVGMTGDGVNDAPALKQAEVGIAVDNATDVAKAAASLVLTRPGLAGVLAAVETGRRIYQRMLTYTMNKIIKTLQIALLLSIGLLLTGMFVTTPRLILLLLFANDFVTMSLAADRVSFSRTPDRWQIRPLVATSLVLAAAWLVFSFAVFFVAKDYFLRDQPQKEQTRQLQTLIFLTLVFTGQATVYLVRERRHLWQSLPGRWLMVSSVGDVIVVSVMAAAGILMTPVAPGLILGLIAATIVFVLLLDFLKIGLYRCFNLR